MNDFKECRTCKQVKLLGEFYTHPHGKDGHDIHCKECLSKRQKTDRALRPSHYTEKDLKSNYGITLNDYNKMFVMQYGKCAICGTHQAELKYRLSVDHDHKTGKIRGLLCKPCNTALGGFRDSQELLIKASDYLELHSYVI